MARESKAEKIYNYIREQIFLGRWEMGSRINDLEISKQIQISRLSVREALFRLIETDIIEKTHWKGYFIKELDEKAIASITEIRIILESEAVKNLITDGTEEDFAEMEQAINTAEKLLLLPQLHYCLNNNDLIGRAINKEDLSSYLNAEYHFHELLHSCQHNSYITSTLKNYLIAIHFIRYIDIRKDENYIETSKRSIQEHRLILRAIKSRDTKLSVKHLVAHLALHEQTSKK